MPPLQVAIQLSQRQTFAAAELATIQTAALILAHDLPDLGRRAPLLPNHTLFICHAQQFNTELAHCLERGWSDAYGKSSLTTGAISRGAAGVRPCYYTQDLCAANDIEKRLTAVFVHFSTPRAHLGVLRVVFAPTLPLGHDGAQPVGEASQVEHPSPVDSVFLAQRRIVFHSRPAPGAGKGIG